MFRKLPPRAPFLAGLLAIAGVCPLTPAGAQQAQPQLELIALPERQAVPLLPADSARILSGTRSAQSRFELIRRNHLPWTWDRGSSPCDERIGRFCLWYGDGESSWKPPPDPEPVARARSTLIERLDAAALAIPGDWWVAGQRVRYLVEAERYDDAIAAARGCRSPEHGWCGALLGFALHAQGEYERAEMAFGDALATMPARERERWTDLSVLLEGGAVREYRRLDEAEREAFEARFWWLADPLFSVPGNDRRTEHFTRHVLDRLQDRARQTEGISWGPDLRELLLRYGAPAGWERIRPRTYSLESASLLTRYPPGSRVFDPPAPFVREPTTIDADGWNLDPRRARTGYAPPYAAPLEELDYQVGTFLRGDSAVVAAALEMRPDSTDTRPAAEAALVLWPDERARRTVDRTPAANGPAILSQTVPAVPTVISLEAIAREEKRAGRARFGLSLGPLPPHGLAASDLLLLESPEPLPDSLAEAIPRTRASTRVRSGERLGVFWEVYGLRTSDLPLEVAVHLLDENAGWLRRAAQRARLLRPQTPLTVRWQEVPEGTEEVLPRSLAIELPELSTGTYTLQLTLTPRGREPLLVRRKLTVEE